MALHDYTFYDLINRNAVCFRNRPAWYEVDDGRRLSFGEVKHHVDRLAAGPTVALGLTKWLLGAGQAEPLEAHLQNEAFALELSSRSEDFREGMAAFVEKRRPDFRGR